MRKKEINDNNAKISNKIKKKKRRKTEKKKIKMVTWQPELTTS